MNARDAKNHVIFSMKVEQQGEDWRRLESEIYVPEQQRSKHGTDLLIASDIDARFTSIDGERIHIELDHDHTPEFWGKLSFSLRQLQQWLASQGYVMRYRREDDDESRTEGSESNDDDERRASELHRAQVARAKSGQTGPLFPRATGADAMPDGVAGSDIVFSVIDNGGEK